MEKSSPALHIASKTATWSSLIVWDMTETTAKDPLTEGSSKHDWHEAGQAWGHSPADWACLYEHYAFEAIAAIFQRVGIGPGVTHLDIACGAGMAIRHAEAMGATTAGIDAAAPLVAVARSRNPQSDLRVGSMFELPWLDDSFDVVTSINGIWGGCEMALEEAYRTLRPGGSIGISFWGAGEPNDIRTAFKTMARYSPQRNFDGMKKLNNIAFPGVAEGMLEQAGFDVLERGSRVSTIEWPDADLAWRALSSLGPAYPALLNGGADAVKAALLAAIDHCRDEHGIYRFCGDHQFVIGRKPGAP